MWLEGKPTTIANVPAVMACGNMNFWAIPQ